jgi:hypothetical protein
VRTVRPFQQPLVLATLRNISVWRCNGTGARLRSAGADETSITLNYVLCSKALDTIKPADIKLVQSFKSPPAAIKLVMEAVCVLLDIKPAKVRLGCRVGASGIVRELVVP